MEILKKKKNRCFAAKSFCRDFIGFFILSVRLIQLFMRTVLAHCLLSKNWGDAALVLLMLL